MDRNQPNLVNKIEDLISLSNIYLAHAPHHEKFSLCKEIRNLNYEILGLVIESYKKYQKKTSLTNLDIAHEKLRTLWKVYWKLGYLQYKNNKKSDDADPLRRYRAISSIIDEIGAMIGGWIKADREKNSKE